MLSTRNSFRQLLKPIQPNQNNHEDHQIRHRRLCRRHACRLVLPERSPRQRSDSGRDEVIGNSGDFNRPVSLWLAGLFLRRCQSILLKTPRRRLFKKSEGCTNTRSCVFS